MKAMGRLRQVGVPFGFSVTVTSRNADEVLSDPFLDFFFDKHGAFYGFFFQYRPIGRTPDLNSMPTPEQRVAFWRRMWQVIEDRKLFVVDMWNHGPLAMGCMSAGREDGYIHVDWNGRVTPCVFIPIRSATFEMCTVVRHPSVPAWAFQTRTGCLPLDLVSSR